MDEKTNIELKDWEFYLTRKDVLQFDVQMISDKLWAEYEEDDGTGICLRCRGRRVA